MMSDKIYTISYIIINAYDEQLHSGLLPYYGKIEH